MLARARDRLTYANVVATLALFVALGGTSLAVTQITSRDIKNRSIKRVDIKKNALTGIEIKESKLGRVPRAGSAVSALTAGRASSADVAKNADALAGQTAQSFEKSSRLQFGRTSLDPAGESGEQAALSWPELGVQVTSATNQGACGGGNLRLAVKNTKSGGPSAQVLGVSGPGSVGGGGKEYYCGSTPGTAFAEVTDSSGRVLFAQCVGSGGEIRCLGVRSEP